MYRDAIITSLVEKLSTKPFLTTYDLATLLDIRPNGHTTEHVRDLNNTLGLGLVWLGRNRWTLRENTKSSGATTHGVNATQGN